MVSFKYYKRGQGELDTSNFNTLLEQGSLTVETPQEIVSDLEITPWYTQYVGADSSVCKFFPRVDVQAQKVRLDGKVLSNQLEKPIPQRVNRVVIVDDILGGGATVRMLVESLRKDGFTGEIYLWVRYNEAIHTEDFIDLFKGVYLGDTL